MCVPTKALYMLAMSRWVSLHVFLLDDDSSVCPKLALPLGLARPGWPGEGGSEVGRFPLIFP